MDPIIIIVVLAKYIELWSGYRTSYTLYAKCECRNWLVLDCVCSNQFIWANIESSRSVCFVYESPNICECCPLNKHMCGRISIVYQVWPPQKYWFERNNNSEYVDAVNISRNLNGNNNKILQTLQRSRGNYRAYESYQMFITCVFLSNSAWPWFYLSSSSFDLNPI